MDVNFSINQYDQDGDIFENCILIHLDNKFILQLKTVEELIELSNSLKSIINEIQAAG